MTLSGAPWRLAMASSRSRQVSGPVPVDDLEEHLLIGDGVHQSVGTQQQVLPGVHRAYVPVTVGGDVRSQGPGDEIAAGVAAGLLSGDVSPVYHAFHQGVVLGDAGDAVLRDVISPAVPHVGDHHAAVIGDGGHQGSAHVPAFLPALCLRLNGLIGQAAAWADASSSC